MKINLLAFLMCVFLASSCSQKPEEEPRNDKFLKFQNQTYTYEGTREAKDNEFIIAEYKQLTSRIYFVKPTREMNIFLFSDKYKKTFEDMGFDVYSLGDEHIGYDEHSIIYIVPAKNRQHLVVLLAVKTAEYKEKHEEASGFLTALKNLDPKLDRI